MTDHDYKAFIFWPIMDGMLNLIYLPMTSRRSNKQHKTHKYISRAMRKCIISYANNNGADPPAHSRSLINAVVVRCSDSIISLDSIAEISRL